MSRNEKPAVAAVFACQHDPDVVRLLEVILAIFRHWNVEWLPTSILVVSLWPIVGRSPWTGFSPEDNFEAKKLALLVSALFIRPERGRFGDRCVRGYQRKWFEQALIRVAASAVRPS